MTNILDKINAKKSEEIIKLKQTFTLAQLEEKAALADAPRGFGDALKIASQDGYGLIAELKKASPSKGLIRSDFDPASISKQYQEGGAACLSVLTDEQWFQGSNKNLQIARAATTLPVLRKDFMIDPIQIIESRSLGADCVLLIMASLSDTQAKELETVAFSYGMDISLEVGLNMLPKLPKNKIAVAESGLFTSDDLEKMARAGARCFLVGESLMQYNDVTEATKLLLSKPYKMVE